uniref:Cyclic nucleotide-binding domain-containing protein n=1 Tax=Meloidogyne hapla TaxID=6305 RepID=A0A1I8B0G0_MELHA
MQKNSNSNGQNANNSQPKQRRRSPFESNRIADASDIHQSTDRQRVFSARVFSASQSRSPFDVDQEQPNTSNYQHHLTPTTSSNNNNQWLKQRTFKGRWEKHLARETVSDDEDEYFDENEGSDEQFKNQQNEQAAIKTKEELEKIHFKKLKEFNEKRRRKNLKQQQSLDIESFQKNNKRRRKIKKVEPLRLSPPSTFGEEDYNNGNEIRRPFSSTLDIQLAEPRKRSRSFNSKATISENVVPPTSINLNVSIKNDEEKKDVFTTNIEEKEENIKRNGSIASGISPIEDLNISSKNIIKVPTPPIITISSPVEQQSKISIQQQESSLIINEEQQKRIITQMNPSLIKGLSKSISRFRGRNRIMDENALEQANFMSKFGMSGTGIQPGDANNQQKNSSRRNWLSNVVFDSNDPDYYHWIALVSIAYVYNLLVVIARVVFIDLAAGRLWILWLVLDLLMDSFYAADMFVRSRTGYLEQGLLVRDCAKIRSLYLKSRQFLVDIASLLPIDHFCLLILWRSLPIFRLNRLLKRERIQRFMEQTETRTSMPNAFRVGVVVWYIAVIIHWNACFYFLISESIGLGADPWVYGAQNKQSLPDGINDTLTRRYIYSFYWSTLILTTIGEVPGPQQNIEYAFVTVDLMCGVLIFATIVGNVGSMISNISAGRTDFQNRIDSIKQYMDLRGVGKQLEMRVIKWFDYLWANKQGLADAQVLKVLPNKLQAEIAMHVHFETLRKVRIFQDCEAGLLAELVLKLQLQVFSPNDYVCRKGDIGREMYIVKRGMLQVVSDDGSKVFATLSEGAVFGELSVGYTDLFVLNKVDLWIALREYPEARKILINKGRELLRKDNLLDENAPEEQKSVEEMTEELQSSVRILQIRVARLMAEHTNTETKLRERISYLESKLRKYAILAKEKEAQLENENSNQFEDEGV